MKEPPDEDLTSRVQTRQLEYWAGEFGDAYIDRNDGQLHSLRRPFFEALVKQAPETRSILEVGCNVAWNLKILSDVDPRLSLAGVEPNHRAVLLAREHRNGTGGVDTPSRDRISAGDGRKFWIMKDLSAWLQRHVMYILRANR